MSEVKSVFIIKKWADTCDADVVFKLHVLYSINNAKKVECIDVHELKECSRIDWKSCDSWD